MQFMPKPDIDARILGVLDAQAFIHGSEFRELAHRGRPALRSLTAT